MLSHDFLSRVDVILIEAIMIVYDRKAVFGRGFNVQVTRVRQK